LASLLRNGSLYCFCLLAESYETINQSINQKKVANIVGWGCLTAQKNM